MKAGDKLIDPMVSVMEIFRKVPKEAFARYYGITRNGMLLVNMPRRVVTSTWPVIAPAGTVVVISESDTTVNVAASSNRRELLWDHGRGWD